jgi:hypothetical protein
MGFIVVNFCFLYIFNRNKYHGASESDSDGEETEGDRVAIVVEIDPKYKNRMLSLDNMDVLAPNYPVRRMKQNNKSILQDIPDAPWR